MKLFSNAADPILKVVDSYFHKKRMLQDNYDAERVRMIQNGVLDESLPEYPATLFRNDENRVERVVYGDLEMLQELEDGNIEECSIVIWQEQFERNEENKVTNIIRTLPDGTEINIEIERNEENKVERLVITE